MTVLQCGINLSISNLTSKPKQISRSTSSPSGWTVLTPRLHTTRNCLFCSFLPFLFKLDLSGLLAPGAIPVVQHLRCDYSIEREGRNKAIEDQLIGDFLEGGEDAGEGAEEVVEDLSFLLALTCADSLVES